MELFAVILSGGVGSRLWPVSRLDRPKPFMRFPDGQSLIQKTFLRVSRLEHLKEVITVTNREYISGTRDEYSEVNHIECPLSYILEPVGAKHRSGHCRGRGNARIVFRPGCLVIGSSRGPHNRQYRCLYPGGVRGDKIGRRRVARDFWDAAGLCRDRLRLYRGR